MANAVNDTPGIESKIGRSKSMTRKPVMQTFSPQKTTSSDLKVKKPVIQTLGPQKTTRSHVKTKKPVIQTLAIDKTSPITTNPIIDNKPITIGSNQPLTDSAVVKTLRHEPVREAANVVNDQMINAYAIPEVIQVPRPKSETMSQVKKVAIGFGVTTVLSLIIKEFI